MSVVSHLILVFVAGTWVYFEDYLSVIGDRYGKVTLCPYSATSPSEQPLSVECQDLEIEHSTHILCVELVPDTAYAELIGRALAQDKLWLFVSEQLTIPGELSLYTQLASQYSGIKMLHYSEVNAKLALTRESGARHYVVPFVPCRIGKQFNELARTHDVCFVGAVQGTRRPDLLRRIEEHFHVHRIEKFGTERDRELAQCKVLVNLHFSDVYRVLESLRCVVGALLGTVILSEKSEPQELSFIEKEFVFFENDGELMDALKFLLVKKYRYFKIRLDRLVRTYNASSHVHCKDGFTLDDLSVFSDSRYHLTYVPSTWESEWSEKIDGEWAGQECDVLLRQREKAKLLIGSVIDATKIRSADESVFSYFIRKLPDGTQRKEYIEPLIGILRDPLTICRSDEPDPFGFGPLDSPVQSKRFLVHGAMAEASLRERVRAKGGRFILFDLGASVYHGWHGNKGEVGAKWFVEEFERHGGIRFDRIMAFEAAFHKPDEIFGGISDPRLLSSLSYFNVPVSADQDSPFNPWSLLAGMATPEDYVVVKLDIDTPAIENRLVIEQLMVNRTLISLVDEMFYEHHVNQKDMNAHWLEQDSPLRMADTYRMFRQLRESGIRMHSWP